MTATEHAIPPMTDRLSRHWKQPARERILIDERHAAMTPHTLAELGEYSASIPTGVYSGKMWRCRKGEGWLLCWFAPAKEAGYCRINSRAVLLV